MIILIGPILFLTMTTLFITLCHGRRFEMDNGLGSGSFYGTFHIYRVLAYTVFFTGLALGSGLLYLSTADRNVVVAAAMLIESAIAALVFVAWTAWCYEMYLGSKYPFSKPVEDNYIGPSNYTAVRYAITQALGWSAVILFVLGIVTALVEVGGLG